MVEAFEGERAKAKELGKKWDVEPEFLIGVTSSAEEMESLAFQRHKWAREDEEKGKKQEPESEVNPAPEGGQSKPLTAAEAEKQKILEGEHWLASREEIEQMDDAQYRRWREAGGHERPREETIEAENERLQAAELEKYEAARALETEDREGAEQKALDAEAAREAEAERLENISMESYSKEASERYKE